MADFDAKSNFPESHFSESINRFLKITSECSVSSADISNPRYTTVEGLKEALRAPVREHVTPFNPAGPLQWLVGHSCSPPGVLLAHTINRAHEAEGKS
jgi:hypothetical protein